MTEDQLEQLALGWFQDTGWEYRHGPDLAPDGDTPERADYRQVVLGARLREAMRRLNHCVREAVFDEVGHRDAFLPKLLSGELRVPDAA